MVELVARDAKSTVIFEVTCASFWVGEKQASGISLLAVQVRRGRHR
jgi:hypothetical protein